MEMFISTRPRIWFTDFEWSKQGKEGMEQVLIWKQFKISCIKFLIFGQKQNYGMKQIGVFAL